MTIRVVMEPEKFRDTMGVWILDESFDKLYILRPLGETWKYEPLDEGYTLPEPSLRFGKELFKAFIEAAMGHAAPDPSVVSHLKDAITVRDRLLTIVEKECRERS